MTRTAFSARSALFCLAFTLGAPAQAQTIFKACVASERGASQRSLCSCVQQVADQTLSDRDKRLVAEFFANPERAQDIRTSNRRVHERFWDRYERFGASAEALCRRR